MLRPRGRGWRICAQGADVDEADSAGFTPMMLAAMAGHAEVVTVLRALGAYLNQANSEGITPMMFAAREGHTEVMNTLCALGADEEEEEE